MCDLAAIPEAEAELDTVVCGSGYLANVYFTADEDRLPEPATRVAAPGRSRRATRGAGQGGSAGRA